MNPGQLVQVIDDFDRQFAVRRVDNVLFLCRRINMNLFNIFGRLEQTIFCYL
jgi:hypothetical protein